MITVNLYEMFGTDTLRHRDTARKVVETLPKESESSQVIIDFAKIDFASRSFLHELLCDLENHKVTFTNRNDEVSQMMNIISKSSVCVQC